GDDRRPGGAEQARPPGQDRGLHALHPLNVNRLSSRPVTTLCAVLLLSAACGKKGDPLPPLRKTPQPVGGLRLAQRGHNLEVTVSAPRATVDGVALPVLEVELLRTDVEGDFAKIAKRQPRIKAAPGETLVESFPLPAPGTMVRIAARAVSKGRPSTLSTVTGIKVRALPEPPTALSAKP